MNTQQFNPPHPGEIIRRTYIDPFAHISVNGIARALKVNKSTFNRLVNGKSDISPEMALRLSAVLGRSPESWLLIQNNYNLWLARKTVDTQLL